MVPSELEGTDYLLSSTMRLEDSFLQILGKFVYSNSLLMYFLIYNFLCVGTVSKRFFVIYIGGILIIIYYL